MDKYDLEERLIKFAVAVLAFCEALPDNRGCTHLAGQLMRSGTAPALMYGEAQAAESRNDFIHKMKMCLKELRESSVCLKVLERHASSIQPTAILKENNELISIFVASIKTASK